MKENEQKELIKETKEVLNDESLDDAAGGVQAGLITKGGSGEFGPKHEKKEKPKQRTWL